MSVVLLSSTDNGHSTPIARQRNDLHVSQCFQCVIKRAPKNALAQSGDMEAFNVTAQTLNYPGFYLRTKGTIERDITALGFRRVNILRPGIPETYGACLYWQFRSCAQR